MGIDLTGTMETLAAASSRARFGRIADIIIAMGIEVALKAGQKSGGYVGHGEADGDGRDDRPRIR